MNLKVQNIQKRKVDFNNANKNITNICDYFLNNLILRKYF